MRECYLCDFRVNIGCKSGRRHYRCDLMPEEYTTFSYQQRPDFSHLKHVLQLASVKGCCHTWDRSLLCLIRYTQDVLRFHDDGASLEDYISLPVSQYVLIDLPLGAQLTRLGSNKFQIDVSKLELAGVYVRPSVQCLVRFAQYGQLYSLACHTIYHKLAVSPARAMSTLVGACQQSLSFWQS